MKEFEIYDEASGKTLNIKANSLEEAEKISEGIDFDDYEDGDFVMAKGGEVDENRMAIQKHRNKLVSLNSKSLTPSEHAAVTKAINIMDMLLDGELILSPEIEKMYKNKGGDIDPNKLWIKREGAMMLYNFIDEKMVEGDEEAEKLISEKGYGLLDDKDIMIDYVRERFYGGDEEAEELLKKVGYYEMAKGGNIPEKEIESLKRSTMNWYGKDGIADDDEADFNPPVTKEEVEAAVNEYVIFCKKSGKKSKWGGADSFDREVVADIIQYNRNPDSKTFFYPDLIKEIKSKMPIMYAKGGKTKSKKFEFQVMFYDGSGDLIDSEYYVDDPSDKEVIQLAKKLDAKTGQLYRDKYESGEYMELVADYDFIDEYAKGGKVKSKKWIQDALGGDEGSLRRTAKRKGLLRGDENLSMTDLKKLQRMGGKTAKRAHLAETLRKFDEGGMFSQDDLHKLVADMDEDEYDNFCAEYDLDCDDANEVENFIYDAKMYDAQKMIREIKSGKYK